MDVAVAGRIAEEIVFGAENAGTGASNDLRNMSTLARQFVTQFGFSEKVLWQKWTY